MKNSDKISDFPSHEILLKYKQNELSVAENSELKNLINENEFYSKAFEGYNIITPSLSEISELKNLVKLRVSKANFNYNYFISILVLNVMFYFLLLGFAKPEKAIKSTVNKILVVNVASSKVNPDRIPAATENESSIILDNNNVLEKTNRAEGIIYQKRLFTDAEIIKPIYTKTIYQTEIEKGLSPVPNKSNVPVKYIDNILVVDYIKMKGKKMTVQNKVISVPAYSEREKYLDDGTTRMKIDLSDLLKKGINAFEKENYSLAIKNLNELEEFFPNDLNVIFYKGMSYYKLNKFKDAIPFFNRAIEHDFNTFQQDAMWYESKSLIAIQNKADAEIVLRKIIESDGYYTNEAKKLSEELHE